MLGFRQVAFCSCLRVIRIMPNHPIAGGINIKDAGITWDATAKEYDIDDDTDRIPNGATSLYYVDAGFDIPDADEL